MVELNREKLYQDLEEMENDLRLYPIEEGLEDDIIDYINGIWKTDLKISSTVQSSNAESLHTTLQMDLSFMLQKSTLILESLNMSKNHSLNFINYPFHLKWIKDFQHYLLN